LGDSIPFVFERHNANMHETELAELAKFLAPYPAEVQKLAMEGRQEFLKLFAPVSEVFWDATQAVCLAFTYTHKPRESFINFAVYADHVTLIFPWGVLLSDPVAKLRGEGSQVRNIRLTGIETLRDPYVLGLIRQAQDNAKRPDSPLEPIVIVKVMNGPKRRP